MKQVGLGICVVLVLAAVTVLSVTGAPAPRNGAPATNGELVVSIDERNPWTNLDLNNRSQNFQFVIVTDRTGGRRPGVFTQAVGKINLLQPEFVVSVGDLINGYTDDPGLWALEWAEFESKVAELEMPFFLCAGNHDVSNVPMSEEWHRKFGRSYYDFRYHDCLFLVLNTEDLPKKDQPYNISRTQQEWAQEVLRQNADVRWTFVFMHKPTWTYPEADHVERGWAAIEDALQGRPYTVFAGHKHQYAKYLRKGREYYMLATTGGGSDLSGLANGRFDHIVWVTMKNDGPVIANLLLDGIEDGNVRTLADPQPKKRTNRRRKQPQPAGAN